MEIASAIDENESPELHGVLVTFRRPEALRDMLESLSEQTRRLDMLVVVDNEPSERNEEVVSGYRRAGFRAAYLPMGSNVGNAGGYAAGIGALFDQMGDRNAWVILGDDDDPPWSPRILEQMARFGDEMRRLDEKTGAVGMGGARFDLRSGNSLRLVDEELAGAAEVDVIGCGMWPFYSSDALRAAGTFTPELFFGMVELDLGLRLKRAGYRLYCNGPLRLEARRRKGHLAKADDYRRGAASPAWRRYYVLRNRIWILRSNDARLAAVRQTIKGGFAKPFLEVVHRRPEGAPGWRLALSACRDGWTDRLGRRVEPPEHYAPKVDPASAGPSPKV